MATVHSNDWNGMCSLMWNRVAVVVAVDEYCRGGFFLSRLCHDNDTDNVAGKPAMKKLRMLCYFAASVSKSKQVAARSMTPTTY